MFSWSQSSQRQQQRRTTPPSTYPAQRMNANSHSGGPSQNGSANVHSAPVLARTVRGSIRPPASSHTRQQHLDSYLNDSTLKRSTRKVSADDSTYDTVFQTTSGYALILRVHLHDVSSSSSCRPAMTLVGVQARHAWLDSRMRVTGYAPIQADDAWQHANTLLGAAVHQVVQHLQLQPPEILEFTDDGLKRLQETLPNTSSNSSTGRRGSDDNGDHSSGAAPAPPDYNTLIEAQLPEMPSVPSEFPNLRSKSNEELQRLMRNDSEFQQLLHAFPINSQYQSLALSLVEENAQVASVHLADEAKLQALHGRVTELQASLQTKLNEYEQLERDYHGLTAPPDASMVLKQLNIAKRQAFEESEQLADTWVDSATAVDALPEFLAQFSEIRQLHHARAAKMELMQQEQAR